MLEVRPEVAAALADRSTGRRAGVRLSDPRAAGTARHLEAAHAMLAATRAGGRASRRWSPSPAGDWWWAWSPREMETLARCPERRQGQPARSGTDAGGRRPRRHHGLRDPDRRRRWPGSGCSPPAASAACIAATRLGRRRLGRPAADRPHRGGGGLQRRQGRARPAAHPRAARDPRRAGARLRHRRAAGVLLAPQRPGARAPRGRPGRRRRRADGALAGRARRHRGGRAAAGRQRAGCGATSSR